MPVTTESIQQAVQAVPNLYRGPGGAVAVLQNGKLAAQHVWGYADLEERIGMTSETLMPICSISKQMLCLLLIDLQRNPPPSMGGDGDIMQQLSHLLSQALDGKKSPNTDLTIQRLCNNQSGIRDYYAMSVLWGARPGGRFSLEDRAMERIISFMFESGTQYSYSNANFHIVARLIEKITKRLLPDLLNERVFSTAGMKTATLCADTAKHPGPCVGYECNESIGFIRASNQMEWSGDAGVVASLSDMIAYEQYVDRSWADPQSLYRTIAEPQVFKDGSPARYGYGLGHSTVGDGIALTGHGGALPGFRLNRLYVPSERLSVIVMFNHEAEAGAAAKYVLKRALNLPGEGQSSVVDSHSSWLGNYLDPDEKLAIQVTQASSGKVVIRYAGYPESLKLVRVGHAESQDTTATIEGDTLRLHRLLDHHVIHAKRIANPVANPKSSDYIGQYRCDEIDSTLHCDGHGGLLYGSFDGYLGQGPAHLMRQIGEDVWILSCPRGLDAPAPGDWTVIFQRDDSGNVAGVVLGCWLARKIHFTRTK